jgi:hypothetical protein
MPLRGETPADTVSRGIPHIAEALRRANVTCVQVKYHGLFDCGVLDDPLYLSGDGVPARVNMSGGLDAELHAFFTELLELRLPEWDNAEGARGEFQWDLGFALLAQAHFVRCTSYRSSIITGL